MQQTITPPPPPPTMPGNWNWSHLTTFPWWTRLLVTVPMRCMVGMK